MNTAGSRPLVRTIVSGLLARHFRANLRAGTVGILTEDMKRLVRDQRLGFVATVCPDGGTPNLSPKGTTGVWDDDHIVFADIRSPATEINVVDPMVRKGYRFDSLNAPVARYSSSHDFVRLHHHLE